MGLQYPVTFRLYLTTVIIMTSLQSEADHILKMVETGVRSAIPWSRRLDLHRQLQDFGRSLRKSIVIDHRLKDLQEQMRQQARLNQKQISTSLELSEMRRRTYVSQKQKVCSMHSKKVKERLQGYKIAQKTQYKKAALNQKGFSDTVDEYFNHKQRQNQSRQKAIYNKYMKESTRQSLDNSQFMLTEVDIPDHPSRTHSKPPKAQCSFVDKIHEVKTRMGSIDKSRAGTMFQKYMRKLARIQNRKRDKNESCKTQGDSSSNVSRYYAHSPPSQTLIAQVKPKSKYMSATNDQLSRRGVTCYQLSNSLNRRQIQECKFQQHSQYLQKYKKRVKRLDNIKLVKDKFIETKLYIRRLRLPNQSFY